MYLGEEYDVRGACMCRYIGRVKKKKLYIFQFLPVGSCPS